MHKIEFEGYESGDSECFCWDLPKQEYLKFKNKKRISKLDQKGSTPNTYTVYPSDLLPARTDWSIKRKFKVSISIEDTTKDKPMW